MFKYLAIAFCVTAVLCFSAHSADAQIFGFNRSPVYTNFAPRYATSNLTTSAIRSAAPRPITGYGSNTHRNFVIRQQQLRSIKTGIQPRTRGNVLWAR